ncbi:uncharacterized protein N7483_005967 [Penicillium malachiteum]|uniref:uncharacterized protein n=1 Tax=Penicillium malachiteum TaxID=1324776 RepID=UPI0025492B28|nr:uncharacterized protein N7483_005967 [Penicillium malachiteum]KAJ5731459.1 hypothetical protein N7483_005967 [Penicillium malachiteum]
MDGENDDLRQRLFWVAYNMDRSLSATLKLPISFPEESISTKPDQRIWETASVGYSNDITVYRSIETEVHRVLHLKEDTPKSRQNISATWAPDMTAWVININSNLEEWYIATSHQEMPDVASLSRRVIYNHLKAKIYRPTPRLPLRTAVELQLCFESCQNVIESANVLLSLLPGAFINLWNILHITFESAIVLLYICWQYRSQSLMRSAASSALFSEIPKCLGMIDEIGRWWGRANLCTNCLRPILKQVKRPYSDSYLESSDDFSISDAATTENLENLMFADRIPCPFSSDPIFSEIDSTFFDDAMYNLYTEDLEWGIY